MASDLTYLAADGEPTHPHCGQYTITEHLAVTAGLHDPDGLDIRIHPLCAPRGRQRG